MEIRNWCGFQYNFCYCSIIGGSEEYNNIYNVSIQLLLLFYIIKHDKHVVSNGFNTNFVTVLFLQYVTLLRKKQGFNTTFVTVLWQGKQVRRVPVISFNTTFVTVLYIMRFYVNCQNICFNTTFVTVLLESPLCLLAYTDRFNTTFVTVLLGFLHPFPLPF